MLMKLEMPLIDASLRGGRVLEWHKREGEGFEFGENICTVAVDEFVALRRTARATLLSGRRRRSLKSSAEVRTGKVYLAVALTASDHGVMGRIVAENGDAIAVGDLLAVVTVDGDTPLEGSEDDWRRAPAMRIVANVLHNDDESLDGDVPEESY